MDGSIVFARWRQRALQCAAAPWCYLANTIELVHPSAHPSLQPNRQIDRFSRFWATLCETVRIHAIGPLSCPVTCVLFGTLMYCGQTVRQIEIKRGTQIGFGPGHILLDGDPAPPLKGAQQLPTFEICLRPYNPRPTSIVAKQLDGSRCHLVRR